MSTTSAPVKLSSLTGGTLVDLYVRLRDRRAVRKAQFENDDADDKAKQEKIEGLLLQRFREDGVTAISGPAGTAYTKKTTSVTMADGGIFFDFCKNNDAWALADVRPNKTNIAAYREENDDLPPGVNWSETTTVAIRRS